MKRNEVIVYEHKKGVRAVKYNQKPQTHIEPPKSRNPVAKNANAAVGGGAAGAHKDAKKASQAVRGQKHKAQPEMAEGYNPNSVSAEHRRELEAHRRKEAEKRAAAGDEKAKQWLERDDERRANMRAEYDRRMEREGVEEMRNRRDAYQRDYDSSVSGMGKRDSLAYQLDGGANDEGWDDEPRQQRSYNKPQQSKGMYFYNVPPEKEADARVYGLKQTKSGKWYSKEQNSLLDKAFGRGRYWEPKTEATGDALGTISATTPDGKVSIKTPTGDEIKTDQSALMPGANGTVQMKPDAAGDALKPGAKVVSTEEEMMAPPTDSSSPIPGDNDHDEISKLLVHRLKRLAGL